MTRGKMTEITILNLLNTRPMYGAEMIEEIKRLSGNTVIMSLPTLYSSLHRMANKEYVRSYQKESTIGGRCRVYNITKYGREYLAKNPIKIDYQQIVDHSTTTNKTFTSLKDAFSLPLNKKPPVQQKISEDTPVLQITPTIVPVTPKPVLQATPKNKEEIKTSLYAPYIKPDEKITTTPEQPHYQQTQIGLSGTTGGNDLRPLVKL
ncbi:MAG: PadR family transcriptional regulator, partial [Clostridia bacterium]|nr:PadR family transcriptional regulator [Clostridia bacterium]